MKRMCLLLEFKVKFVLVDAMKAYVRVELQRVALLIFEGDEGELSVSRPGRLNLPVSTEWYGEFQSRYGHSRDRKVFCFCPVAYRGGGLGGSNPPPLKFRHFDKVPKIKKILLYEMKFLVPNYDCLQNPWLRGHCPQIPVLSVLNWICWTPPLE
jgi:hypothetical protein